MHHLHKNPSGEIKLNFDTVTDKMMRDKVQNEKLLAEYSCNPQNPFYWCRNLARIEVHLKPKGTALM